MVQEKDRTNSRHLSLFWKNLIMMTIVVLFMMSMMLLTNRIFRRNLINQNLSMLQNDLDNSCSELSKELYSITLIPPAIEKTETFASFRNLNAGYLPPKYYPAMADVREEFIVQSSVLGDTSECFLFIPSLNAVCCREYGIMTMDYCFERYLSFEDINVSSLKSYFDTAGLFKILPAGDVTVKPHGESHRCFAVVSRPGNCASAVLILFTSEELLLRIHKNAFPEGTAFRMECLDGTELSSWDMNSAEHYDLWALLPEVGARVYAEVPADFISELDNNKRRIMMITAFAFIIGICLCFLFSRISVAPIRRLVRIHAAETKGNDELRKLDDLLTSYSKRTSELSNEVRSNLLSRLFYGDSLSDGEYRTLSGGLRITEDYTVMIIAVSDDKQRQTVYDELSLSLPEGAVLPLSGGEIGAVCRGNAGDASKVLTDVLERTRIPENRIGCGISGEMMKLTDFRIGVREARMVLAPKKGISLYSGEKVPEEPLRKISWDHHVRLYQSILSNNQEAAGNILREAASNTSKDEGSLVFYNFLYVIISATEEVSPSEGILGTMRAVKYNYDASPAENMLRLQKELDRLFIVINEKSSGYDDREKYRIISYIKKNFCNEDICLTSAAEELSVSGKKISRVVKEVSGQSFSDYVLKLRMERCEKFLRETDMKIGDIAKACGYSAESTFFRVFRNYYGIPAGQYRHEHKALTEQKEKTV